MFEFLNDVNPIFIVIGVIIVIIVFFKIIKAFKRFLFPNIGIERQV